MLTRYLLLVVVDLLVTFLNFFLAPIVVLFASEDGWLPNWLSWFQTPDNPLDGDNGWKTEHRPYKEEKNKYQRWVNRFMWLYRNSMYGFAINVMGCKLEEGYKLMTIGDPMTSNRPIHNGQIYKVVTMPNGKQYFQFYFVRTWESILGLLTPSYLKDRCIRINLGWKLWGDMSVGQNKQFTFSPNPLMGFANVA